MAQNFEALIFDLGGVLYHVDTKESAKAFAALGLPHFEDFYSLQEQTALFDALEKGQISADEFCGQVNRLAGMKLEKGQIIDAWNALLLEFPAEKVELLRELRKTHKLYLLSNTNVIHMTFIHAYLHRHFGITRLDDLFDQAYYSYKVGLRKPDESIYRLVVEENGLVAGRTLFIDDSQPNLDGAAAAGLHVHLHPRNTPLGLEAVLTC